MGAKTSQHNHIANMWMEKRAVLKDKWNAAHFVFLKLHVKALVLALTMTYCEQWEVETCRPGLSQNIFNKIMNTMLIVETKYVTFATIIIQVI